MDFKLTEEQIMIRQMVREFAQNEVKPLSQELDAKTDPKECLSWELIKKASKLGLRTLCLPTEYGGGGAGRLTRVIVLEELGAADMGLGMGLGQTITWMSALAQLCNKQQIEEFIPRIVEDDTYMIAIAYTEPNHGIDVNLPYDAPGIALDTVAKRVGDEYIINGMKHFITNGGIAKLYLVGARTGDKELGIRKNTSLFLVPSDTPGFSVARFHDKLGRRLQMNAEIVLEDVRIPTRYLVGKENQWLPTGSLVSNSVLTGTLRTCYEEALDYAKTRVQGGRPIIQHPTVAARLADMRVKIEAIRLLLWRHAWSMDTDYEYDPKMDGLLKAFACEMSLNIINETVEIFGGMGTDKEMPIEKYIRDIYTNLHGFGGPQIALFKGAPTLE